MSNPRRYFDELRTIIKKHGGTIEYERKGHPSPGAWVINLDGKEAVIRGIGDETFPELDRLYMPKVVEPKLGRDRHIYLLDDAEEHLLALLE